jgi:hypothetical protein
MPHHATTMHTQTHTHITLTQHQPHLVSQELVGGEAAARGQVQQGGGGHRLQVGAQAAARQVRHLAQQLVGARQALRAEKKERTTPLGVGVEGALGHVRALCVGMNGNGGQRPSDSKLK